MVEAHLQPSERSMMQKAETSFPPFRGQHGVCPAGWPGVLERLKSEGEGVKNSNKIGATSIRKVAIWRSRRIAGDTTLAVPFLVPRCVKVGLLGSTKRLRAQWALLIVHINDSLPKRKMSEIWAWSILDPISVWPWWLAVANHVFQWPALKDVPLVSTCYCLPHPPWVGLTRSSNAPDSRGSTTSHRADFSQDGTEAFSQVAHESRCAAGSYKNTFSWQVNGADITGKRQGGGAARSPSVILTK